MRNRGYLIFITCVLLPACIAWGLYLGRHLDKPADEFWTAIYVASPAIIAVICLVAAYLASRTKRSAPDSFIRK